MFKLTLVHTNDTHSHIEPSRVVLDLPCGSGSVSALAGGFSMLDSYIQQVRNEATGSDHGFLYLDAGDTFEGSLYFNCFNGQANADLFNEMGLNAMAVGNHEFDNGDDNLANFIKLAQFPVIASNMELPDPQSTSLQNGLDNLYCQNNPHQQAHYHIEQCHGFSVGMIGVSFEHMHSIASPSKGVKFNSVESTVCRAIDELHAQDVRIIVVLSHLGIEIDRMLAQNIEGISVLIGGHSHLLQGDFSNLGWDGCCAYGDGRITTPIVQAGFNATTVGRIDLEFDEAGQLLGYAGGNTLLLDQASIKPVDAVRGRAPDAVVYLNQQNNVSFQPQSTRIEDKLDRLYRPALSRYVEKELCHIRQSLRHVRLPDTQGGSLVAPLVARSFVEYVLEQGFDVDIGLVNAGAIRSGLAQGVLTQADVTGNLLPFPISLQLFSISGVALTRALHQAVDIAVNRHASTGSYPYLSHLRFNESLVNHPSPTAVELEILNGNNQWERLVPDRFYRVATTSYVAEGKEGFAGFACGIRDLVDMTVRASEVFSWFVQQPRHGGLF